jgi:hypothetical protein
MPQWKRDRSSMSSRIGGWCTLALLAPLVATLLLPTRSASAQGTPPAGSTSPYPMNDTPITLKSGTVVRLRNIVVFRAAEGTGIHGSSISLYIETPTPAADTTRVEEEARELADGQIRFADQQSFSAVTIGVCRTRACLEMREVPPELFRYRRGEDGQWRREPSPTS